jgi:putative tryptophan/tyrosine transport system substrate-binding protein
MRRREFITLLGSAAAAWPLAARAQQPAMPVVGYLSARNAETDVPMVAAFRQGLHDNGYVEGKNVAIEFRWGEGQYDRLPAIAKELVRRHVDVIVTSGGEITALAAKAETAKIPIVFNVGNDPVRFGLVASLSRPGGNLTGVTSFGSTLGTKQLGFLRELVPTAKIVAVLMNPKEPYSEAFTGEVQKAASAIGQQIIVLQASTERDIDSAFADLIKQRVGALLIASGPFFLIRKDQLVALATHHAVPVLYYRREFIEAGGLISYGSTTVEGYRQMGDYTGRILKGEKPAVLPVLQPTKFELVINLKTAKALGLTILPMLLARADEVIE